jgi:hypothetical protein
MVPGFAAKASLAPSTWSHGLPRGRARGPQGLCRRTLTSSASRAATPDATSTASSSPAAPAAVASSGARSRRMNLPPNARFLGLHPRVRRSRRNWSAAGCCAPNATVLGALHQGREQLVRADRCRPVVHSSRPDRWLRSLARADSRRHFSAALPPRRSGQGRSGRRSPAGRLAVGPLHVSRDHGRARVRA